MDEEAKQQQKGGGVAESTGDTDIDQLLRAHTEIDETLKQHKTQFAVLFTDIVGSTAFFERYGDTAGLFMLERHNELVMPAIEDAGGTVVKTIGDAVMAVFSSPVTAVQTSVKIQQRLDAYNEDRPTNERIYTRVGLNFGRGYVKAKDVFGDVVNVAARVVKACAAAQVLISHSVYEAVEKQEGIQCRKLGSAAFHGKSAEEEIYEVLWTAPERYERLREQLDARAGPAARSVLGRYEILDELGQGAMGVVYKAYDPTVGRIVALKTVQVAERSEEREELIRRLRQEAQAAGRLEHPNIVTIYDAGEIERMFYITMQFVKGRTVGDLMANRTLLPVKQILLLLEQACEALQYAHDRGIVHRDLKPNNILVARDGLVKIVDFGIAKIAGGGTTTVGTILGTPSYMSPEQAQGGRVDRRSDIFSLGAILYELLTGEKAFPGNTPTAILYKIVHEDPIPPRVVEPGVEPALEKIVHRALTKDPLARYQNCREMLADLKAMSKPPTAPSKAPVKAPRPVLAVPPKPKSRMPAALLALSLWAVVAFLGWREGRVLLEPYFPTQVAQPSTPQQRPLRPPVEGQPVSQSSAGAERPPDIPVAAGTGGSEAAGKAGQPGAPKKGADQTATKTPTDKPPPEKREPPAATAVAGKESTATPNEGEGDAKPPATDAKGKDEAVRRPARRKTPPPQPALSPQQEREVKQWMALAVQYDAKGEYASAVIALQRVLSIDPKHEKAKQLLEGVRRKQALRRGNRPQE